MSPIFEFECRKCNETIEQFFGITAVPRTIACESCGSTMVRVISATSFQLKGSGWAKDGYSSTVGDAIKAGANIRGTEE